MHCRDLDKSGNSLLFNQTLNPIPVRINCPNSFEFINGFMGCGIDILIYLSNLPAGSAFPRQCWRIASRATQMATQMAYVEEIITAEQDGKVACEGKKLAKFLTQALEKKPLNFRLGEALLWMGWIGVLWVCELVVKEGPLLV